MVVATETVTTFRGLMVRETVLAHVDRLMKDGIEKDEAITQTLDAIIEARRANDFVRAFGGTSIKGMLTSREAPKHPIRYTPPEERAVTERDDGSGHDAGDTHAPAAAPSSPEPIPQTFPAPGTGRVLNMAKLRDARKLTGLLAGAWSVDGQDVPMGLLSPEQCFKLQKIELGRGKPHIQNGTMFGHLGTSLSRGEVVADRWDSERIHILFKASEPKL